MNLYKIWKTTLNTIYSLYKIHRNEDLIKKHKNNKYSYDFKIKIIKKNKSSNSLSNIAKKLK
ncbi:hypothetical protein [Metamycoplasma canadense]|uniref:hypothetical protein n=1 Tax=Metamycoplasma canadense TaxID=29554 RepID=UPI0005F0B717|nr:hypothetical protein [Metamycoplasma canadense]